MKARVLVLAGGAPWEAGFLDGCAQAGLVVVGRCIDVVDLMAAATLGQAEVAVVSAEIARLDADAVAHVLRCGVPVLAVGGEEQFRRWGATTVAPETPAVILAAALETATARAVSLSRGESDDPPGSPPDAPARGRVVAVWGPTGAPGRSTVAVTLAGEHAARGRRTVLLDADPYGGSVAQQLGILDETSGLLAAARRLGAGTFDARALVECCRQVGPDLAVLSGLPRSDRRIEVRPGALGRIIAAASELGDVVLDTGATLEDQRNDRDRMTCEALDAADEIVVVGSADPVGLARLARALVTLAEVQPRAPSLVVVNRVRPALGWDHGELRGLVAGFTTTRSVVLVPEAREHLDRALVAGRSLVELGDAPVRRALAAVVDVCFGVAVQAPKSR